MRVKTLSFFSLKNDQKEYDIFMPGMTPEVLQEAERGRGSDSDDEEAIPVKGKGKGRKGKGKDKKGKGKGRGKFNPLHANLDIIDPLKLVWTPLPREALAKGSGRTNYRALKPRTLYDWLHSNECKRVMAEGGDVSTVQINLEDYALPEYTPSVKKSKDAPKRQREQVEDPEKKRIRKGGPPAIDNPIDNEHLWSPVTNPHWEPCRKKKILQYGMAASHLECSLCPGAKAFELVPCCWCTHWIHLRCSYAVPEGRACASHFDVVNPLEKQVLSSTEDDTIPENFREDRSVQTLHHPR